MNEINLAHYPTAVALLSEYVAMGTLTTDAANSPVTEAPITLQLNLNPTISHRMNHIWCFAIPKAPLKTFSHPKNAVVRFCCGCFFSKFRTESNSAGWHGRRQPAGNRGTYIGTYKKSLEIADVAPLPASVCSSWTPWQQRHLLTYWHR